MMIMIMKRGIRKVWYRRNPLYITISNSKSNSPMVLYLISSRV